MKFFDYCFYRIHQVYIKRKIDKHPQVYSSNWVSFGQVSNIMVFVQLFLYLLEIKCHILLIAAPLYIIISGMNCFFIMTTEKYEKLLEMYKNETHRTLKGWGVLLYEVISFALCAFLILTLRVFDISALS